jgi:methanethiol S-methyltransferase
MKRLFWTVFGGGVQVLFGITVLRLFPFLQGGGPFRGLFSAGGDSSRPWFWVDGLLALLFVVPHSVLLWPRVRDRLTHSIPPALFGCVFCAVSCVGLLVIVETWRPSPAVVWRVVGPARSVVGFGYLLSWVALLYSISLTGFGYQTGFTNWWSWVRGREIPIRKFEPRGAYLLLRHPVYMSLLCMVWLNPVLTLDRVLFGSVWTVYIFLGSHLKDRRLSHYIGGAYRHYQMDVPGYPFIPFGPLARLSPRGANYDYSQDGSMDRPEGLSSHTAGAAAIHEPGPSAAESRRSPSLIEKERKG